jgi:hypothetical protein
LTDKVNESNVLILAELTMPQVHQLIAELSAAVIERGLVLPQASCEQSTGSVESSGKDKGDDED